MAESEKQPLLGEENKDGRPGDATRPEVAKSRKRCTRRQFLICVATIACTIIITAAISGTVTYGVMFALHKNSSLDCQKSTINAAYSRSGSYSILDTVTSQDLKCSAQPLMHLSLKDEDSVIEIYQTPCQGIETRPILTHYNFNDLPSTERSIPLFNEDFSPQNYFVNGAIEVGIINATATVTSDSIDIELCLFSDYYQYNIFLNAGIKWKNYTKNAVCKTVTSDEPNHTISFNITKPMFAFLGMATTYPMHIDIINITATGQAISDPGKNSTKVCQLNGETAICDIGLPNEQELENGSICVVAYEEGNPDGTYDYSDLIIGIPNEVKRDNPYKMRFKIYGFTSLGVVAILILALFMFMLIVGAVKFTRKITDHKRRQNNSTTKHHSVQNRHDQQVAHDPVEAWTTQCDPKSVDRQMLSIAGNDQLQQQSTNIQKHQTPREGIAVDQDAAASRENHS